METIIRKAEKSDTKAIFSLIQELAVYEREPDAVIINESTFEEHGFGKKPLFKGNPIFYQGGCRNGW